MVIKIVWGVLFFAAVTGFLLFLSACQRPQKKVFIGVSVSAMNAVRWDRDVFFMEKRAKELGAKIEMIVSDSDPEQQYEECKGLIDQGIDVLILTPGSAIKAADIVKYAHENKVKVISYDRVVLFEPVDLIVTFDGNKVGEIQGKYLIETVDEGNYVILLGDEGDTNSMLLYDGAMKYIEPLVKSGKIQILTQENVPDWSSEEAGKIIQKILKKYPDGIDGILAPNDTIAGGCHDALVKAGVDRDVAITGMDADLEALKRIIRGEQDITVFKDIRVLASTSVEQAVKLGKREKPDSNSILDNLSSVPAITLYIEPQLVTKENIERVLIQSSYYTKEEVYTEDTNQK